MGKQVGRSVRENSLIVADICWLWRSTEKMKSTTVLIHAMALVLLLSETDAHFRLGDAAAKSEDAKMVKEVKDVKDAAEPLKESEEADADAEAEVEATEFDEDFYDPSEDEEYYDEEEM